MKYLINIDMRHIKTRMLATHVRGSNRSMNVQHHSILVVNYIYLARYIIVQTILQIIHAETCPDPSYVVCMCLLPYIHLKRRYVISRSHTRFQLSVACHAESTASSPLA